MSPEQYSPESEPLVIVHEMYTRTFHSGERFKLNDGREWEVAGSTAHIDGKPELIVLYTIKINPQTKKRERLELTAEELMKRIVNQPINHAA